MSDAHDLERTCRCCMQESSKLEPLTRLGEILADSYDECGERKTIGNILMEVGNIKVLSRSPSSTVNRILIRV